MVKIDVLDTGNNNIFSHISAVAVATVDKGGLKILTIEGDGSHNEYVWPPIRWGRYSIEEYNA